MKDYFKNIETSQQGTTVNELREELSVVKQTASGAISTLSTSLKKSLYVIKIYYYRVGLLFESGDHFYLITTKNRLQSQELCSDFEKDRLEMKEANESAQQRIRDLENNAEQLESELSECKTELSSKNEELKTRADTMEQQRLRTHEAKERLKQDIQGTRQLIMSQQEVLGDSDTPTATS